MKRNDWPVGDYGIRPNGKPGECFYCGAAKGTQHRMGCVIRDRTIVVRMTIEYVRAVPEDWTVENIEFFHNEGSRCVSNDIDELVELNERLFEDESCPCDIVEFEFVREATDEDEERCKLFVKDRPS